MQKNYRLFIIIMLLAIMLICGGWFCFYSIQKNKVYEDATLIRLEVRLYEGEV